MKDGATEYRPYRLGIDVGSNSLGWFVVWLNDEGEATGLGPGGVRIYPDGRDPKSKESNAADRRVARGARRRRDRYLKRRSNLMSLLIAHGLMPEDETKRKELEKLDPYELRAKALDKTLPVHHIGRALFHLNQRRGFLSNRKTEKKKNSESGVIKIAASKLQQSIKDASADTLGEFFYQRHLPRKIEARQATIRAELERLGKDHLKGTARKKAWTKVRKRLFPDADILPAPESVRARNRGTSTKVEYDFYPTRQLLLDEFDTIWKKQAPHHASMTDEAYVSIHDEIFYQRPLKQQPVGKCSLDPARDKTDTEGFRCSWAHPLAQRFRIWQEVRNLGFAETGRKARPLTKEQGDNIARILINDGKPALTKSGELSFNKIRNILGVSSETLFNIESERRGYLKGDLTAAKLSDKNFFGKAWRDFPLDQQIEIVTKLETEEEPKKLQSWLLANTCVGEETADRVASAALPDGHCRLGLRAIKKLLRHMENGLDKTQAETIEYPGAHEPTGELLDELPYYGERLQDDVVGTGDPDDPTEERWGRFPNPTVHIGLGQIRRVVNALIAGYGPPTEITVEMTRDFKLSPKKLAELEKEQAENQKKNEKRAEEIRKEGQAVNARNLLKMRLWEELNTHDPLDRHCPYTGEKIGVRRLLSEEVDIDHLIPFSDSWDDSAANKVICMRYANRDKGNRTPFEAFGGNAGTPYDWEAISLRAAALPKGKRWRFDPDARQHFKKIGGFQARQLNETGWLARVARHYLTAITDPHKIHVLPGKLTAMIRRKWDLNCLLSDHNYNNRGKNRKDHRHHAIDAMVAALTDGPLLHRMSSAYDEERERIKIPLPWESLRDDLDARLKAMIVSHRPDHGVQARLFKDGAFGTIRNPKEELDNNLRYLACDGAGPHDKSKRNETVYNLVYRKPFISLSEGEVGRIRDIRLREMVRKHIADEQTMDLQAALRSFSERTDIPGLPHGIRHVRLVDTKEPEYMVPVRRKTGDIYKQYFGGENAFVEIFETVDGQWHGEAMLVFTANQKSSSLNWRKQYADASFVMRIHKGDLIALNVDGQRIVMVVRQLDASNNRFKLAAHNEAGQLQDRHEKKKDQYKDDPFRWLMASYNTLKAMNAERVRVDELGRLWRIAPEEAARALGYGG